MQIYKNRTRIKICGMTDVTQVEHAVSLGVDAIGVILHANSPRVIALDQAKLIRDVIPAFVTLVGVFVDADRDQIEASVEHAGLDLIQLHGDESDELGQSLSRPYIKAIRAKSKDQVLNDGALFPSASGILLDPYVKGQHGGTGVTLNDTLWPNNSRLPSLMLAGGLSPNNVAERIRQLSPYAVDLNSGLEVSPGQKDPSMVAQAVNQVYLADTRSREFKRDA